MAEPVISFVVETLGNLLIEEGKFLHGVGDQAHQLQTELKRMRWFLQDADSRQNEADRIREWVSQIRELAYEAENLLERYAFKVQSRRGRGVRSIIKRCACLLDECLTRHQVGSDIEYLKTKIADLTKSFGDYGIRAIMEKEGGSGSRQQQFRRTYSHAVEEDLVGLESQVEMLLKHLTGENYRLVSIYGMGGLGKTTLARKVYRHPDVRRYFEVFCWICVSQQWQTRDLLQGIVIKLMPEKRKETEKWRDEELIRQIFEFQQNRKCLVVLDDIWSIDAWECIKHAFPIREEGSKVLLTTRNREVAMHIDASGFLHQPRFLSKEESWELLRRKSLIQRRTQDCEEIHKMEELGKDMVQHCGGLPLAVLVLGGILATKHDAMEWENVHRNIKSYLGKGSSIGQDEGEVQNILALSYNDLPYQLKPCFLYLSKYLEDVDIETESLYQIWMAEGMISMDDRIGEETMMDIAERYLGELAERCMVFVEMEGGVPVFQRFRSCRLHDLMRDLCMRKAKEENFLELINYRSQNGTELVDSSFFINRLAIRFDAKDVGRYVPVRKELAQHLRSFTFSMYGVCRGRFARTMKLQCDDFKLLRVLSIEELFFDPTDRSCGERVCLRLDHFSIPPAIGDLIHLRYLSLRYSQFFIIPSSIGNLKHLQTLDLRLNDIERIPNAVCKLERLKHLYLPYNDLHCKFGLGGLHNLEILENFNNRNSDVKVLSTLINLRSLTARVSKNLDDLEEFINQVNKLTYLRFLSLDIGYCDFSSEKGSTLLREVFRCSHLNYLYIGVGKISKLPEYEARFAPNLYSLQLSIVEMEEDPMRLLEKLPNLRRLIIIYRSFIGEEMICHATGFPKLKFLKLSNMPNLNNWWIEEGAMPNLSRLIIVHCPKLKMIPDGLRFISTLKELDITYMPEEFRMRLQVKDGREGEDFDKVRHVPSIILHSF